MMVRRVGLVLADLVVRDAVSIRISGAGDIHHARRAAVVRSQEVAIAV
ncbi:hypothetical protein BGE01nite_55710 [Brevifollis gellanilyticus]|uniref:Uncharacterized protein n=1 Tax=Brevifollis gellanilyticus TaxID=748831 RepID=A0A512MHS2_9BACT|nr:hypothetical protein BGE01nite_55710 [Brevifollis gellanilyticus]